MALFYSFAKSCKRIPTRNPLWLPDCRWNKMRPCSFPCDQNIAHDLRIIQSVNIISISHPPRVKGLIWFHQCFFKWIPNDRRKIIENNKINKHTTDIIVICEPCNWLEAFCHKFVTNCINNLITYANACKCLVKKLNGRFDHYSFRTK